MCLWVLSHIWVLCRIFLVPLSIRLNYIEIKETNHFLSFPFYNTLLSSLSFFHFLLSSHLFHTFFLSHTHTLWEREWVTNWKRECCLKKKKRKKIVSENFVQSLLTVLINEHLWSNRVEMHLWSDRVEILQRCSWHMNLHCERWWSDSKNSIIISCPWTFAVRLEKITKDSFGKQF